MKETRIIAEQQVEPHQFGISSRELMLKVYPPIKEVVSGYLVEGLTIFAGAPKLGKSWLALNMASSVALGALAFGSIPVEQGDALYLALEDSERRLQDRLRKMGIDEGSDRLTFAMDWPNLDDGCIDKLRRWVEAVYRPRLIVIDVYAKVRGAAPSRESSYQADYGFVGKLQDFATEVGLALVLIHHTRKQAADDPFDAVSGTRGITGAADSTLVLAHDPEGHQPILYGRGRDLEQFETAIEFEAETGLWRILGGGNVVAKTAERRAILQLLSTATQPLTPSQIAAALEKERSGVNHLLSKLVRECKVVKHPKGAYALSY